MIVEKKKYGSILLIFPFFPSSIISFFFFWEPKKKWKFLYFLSIIAGSILPSTVSLRSPYTSVLFFFFTRSVRTQGIPLEEEGSVFIFLSFPVL